MRTYDEAKKAAKKFFGKDWEKLTQAQKEEAIKAAMDSYNRGYHDASGGRKN